MTSSQKTRLMIGVSACLTLLILAGGGYALYRASQLNGSETLAPTTTGSGKHQRTGTKNQTVVTAGPELLDITQFGSNEDDTAEAIAVDATGLYIVGETEGSLDATNAGDLSTATPGGTAEGVGADHTFGLPDARDGFIEKYSLDGKTKLWGHQLGTDYRDTVRSVVVNTAGVYISGETEGSLDGTLQGDLDVFLRKYTPNGTLVWAKQFGTSNRDENTWMVADNTRVCMGGGTLGTFAGFTKHGNEDIFARCFDTDGNELWTLQFGTEGFQETLGATLDDTGIYVTGATSDAIGTDQALGQTDMWFGHISLDGQLVETHQFGSKAVDFGHGIATDGEHVYINGRTEGKIHGETSAGSIDAAIFAYSKADGSQVWADQYGTSQGDGSQDVAADPSGVYMIGTQNGKTEKHAESVGSEDGFIREYSPAGKFLWMGDLATDDYDEPRSILIENNILYVVGRTGGAFEGQNYGAWDGFIARYQLGR